MKTLLLSSLAIAVLALTVSAQEVRPETRPSPDQRAGNLLQQLGLSPEQVQQIRRLNITRKPIIEAAQARAREANRALDAAIYADSVDENEVKARLEDLHRAQAEIVRIRFLTELAIRRVLTPEQLVRFRELRQRVETAREGSGIRPARVGNGLSPGNNDGRDLRRLMRQNRARPAVDPSPKP